VTASTESDIKELKDLIQAQTEQIHVISNDLNELKISIAKIDTRLDTWKPSIDKIPDLAEKIGELKNWRQIAFIAITATIGGIVGWLARGGSFRN
jgi:chromosome segregation ATPase